MAFSDSAFGAAVACKCPRCRKGNLFVNKNPYVFSEMAKMPKYCPSCGLRLEPETGFYYGAMYLSYAMGVFSSLIFFSLLNFGFGIPTTYAFLIVAGLWLFGSPYLFRFSRSLWLSLYVTRHRDI
ncbi:MAG: DUF983 domain-containing protein [Bacteroidetes bacterium]|nr:DUF983 domain-containing protein [Bacteroidota bacterium]MBK8343541.1 DUF983 domain-containing protein [Bacteroidota bacterium]